MTIVIYDFDKTIYDGDSMIDFYKYCVAKQPLLVGYLPYQVFHIVLFKLGLEDRTQVKSNFFSFLRRVNVIDQRVTDFWQKNEHKIKQWYRVKNHSPVVIVSASPEFLLQPLLPMLGAHTLIATRLDKQTGKISGRNCYGVEKVIRLREEFHDLKVAEVYSDSLSDMPILQLAKKKYIVKGNRVMSLDAYIALPFLRRFLL